MGGIITYTRQLLSTPPSLTPNGLYDALTLIIEELSSATSYTTEDHVQVGSFLSVLRASGLDHRAEYMVAAVKAVLNYSDLVENIESDGSGIIADIVGTGGDGQNTFNFSTSAAIIASGIPGIKICKHGGKASTSSSGAGDLINMLGCNSSKVTSESVAKLWDNSFVFLLAPYFHRAMRAVAPIRKELGIPTIFNVLGPLMNPVAAVNKRVLGVYSENLAPEYIKAASLLYKESEIFVVWGHIGIDEVSPIGKTTVWHYIPNNATIDVFDIEPADFGLPEHDIKSCASLGSAKNAERLLSILRGESQRGDPIYDVILLNTALLYCLCNGTKDWAAGVEAVEASIKSSRALDSLNSFIASLETL